MESMKVDVEQVAACVRRLTIEVPADRVNRELDAIYRNLQRQVKVPGFRPGKVPRRLLENRYRLSVEQEALQKLLPEALSAALSEEKLYSVGEPQIDQVTLTKDQPLRFVATAQIVPDFAVADYQGWQFERRIPVVTEADIDAALQRARERHAALEAVAGRSVQHGDFVILAYQGFRNDHPLPGVEATNALVEVGAGLFLPEIEQGLIGVMPGEEHMIPVHFPEQAHNTALAGQTVQFRVRVAEIKEKILPTLDDDFARAYEEVDSLAALRDRLRGELEVAAREKADEALRQEILTKLVAANPIEVPEVLVHEQMRRLYLRQKRQETGRELTPEEYQVDLASLPEELTAQALEMVREQLILHRIGTDAEITVTPEEVDAEVAAMAARMAQNPEALKRALEHNGSLSALETSLRERKIFATLLAKVQVTDKILQAETAAPTT
jgi:trigger factor